MKATDILNSSSGGKKFKNLLNFRGISSEIESRCSRVVVSSSVNSIKLKFFFVVVPSKKNWLKLI